MGEVVAIVNRTAGKGKCGRLWPQIEAYLQQLGLNPAVEFTKGEGDAIALAKKVANNGAQTVLSVGGDGTLNEVVNGLVGNPETTLGVIPAGSGNDFIRSLGIKPSDWQSACRIIANGYKKAVDLGQVNGRYFVNVSGVGFDATVVNCANTWGRQHFPTKLAYTAAVLKTLREFKPTRVRIQLDDQEIEAVSWLVVVASGQYFGGGMWVAPEADLHDGLFDVCILADLSKPAFLRAFPSVFNGKHLSHPAIRFYRARQVSVIAEQPLLVQADGEVISQTPISFKVQHASLPIFQPER